MQGLLGSLELAGGTEFDQDFPLLEEISIRSFFPCTICLLCVKRVRSQVNQSGKFPKETDSKEFACFVCDHEDT